MDYLLILYGGMIYNETDTENFLSIATSWLSLTPYSSGKILYPNSKGKVNQYSRGSSRGVRVMIALKNSAYILSGNGTKDTPYKVAFPKAYNVKKVDYEIIKYDDKAMQSTLDEFKVIDKPKYKLTKVVLLDNDNNEIDVNIKKNSDNYSFTMPSKDVTIKPIFEIIKYNLSSTNTEVTINKENIIPENEASFTLEYDENAQTLLDIKFYDEDNNEVDITYTKNGNNYTFTMPEKNIVIKSIFQKIQYKLTTDDQSINIPTEDNDANSETTFNITYDDTVYIIKNIIFYDENNNEVDFNYNTDDNHLFKINMPTKNIKVKATIDLRKYNLSSNTNFIEIEETELLPNSEAKFKLNYNKDEIIVSDIEFYDQNNNKLEIDYTINNENEYSFTMIKKDITIKIIYKELINPKTIDNIHIYIILLIVSILGLITIKKVI